MPLTWQDVAPRTAHGYAPDGRVVAIVETHPGGRAEWSLVRQRDCGSSPSADDARRAAERVYDYRRRLRIGS